MRLLEIAIAIAFVKVTGILIRRVAEVAREIARGLRSGDIVLDKTHEVRGSQHQGRQGDRASGLRGGKGNMMSDKSARALVGVVRAIPLCEGKNDLMNQIQVLVDVLREENRVDEAVEAINVLVAWED